MTDQKRKRMMYGILIAAVIWGIWNYPFSDRRGASGTNQASVAPSTESLVDSILQAQADLQTAKKDVGFPNIGWTTDPFAGHVRHRQSSGPSRPAPSGPDLRLSGISSVGDQRMAIINGELAGPNATVAGWTVARIDPDAVVLTSGDRKKTLKLNGDR